MRNLYLALCIMLWLANPSLAANFYSISSGPWSDPTNWSKNESGFPVSTVAPGPNDHVFIRDNITHTPGSGYTHYGDIAIKNGSTYYVITGFGVSDPFIFAGALFEISGVFITSSDFHNQIAGTNGYGIVKFNENASVQIGDDFVLNARSVTLMNNAGCGADASADDIYFQGVNASVCGTGVFVVNGDVQSRDINGQFYGDIANPTLQTCTGMDLFGSTQHCNDNNPLLSGGGPPPATFPVEFLGLDATLVDGRVKVEWSTASELNNNYFTVERSIDSRVFETIEQVQGAGTTNEINSYASWDNFPPLRNLYYRIKQTDFDGNFSYSDIVEVKAATQQIASFRAFPNPIRTGPVQLELHGWAANQRIEVRLVDAIGRVLLNKQFETNSFGGLREAIELDEIEAGNYFISITDGTQRLSKRIVRI